VLRKLLLVCVCCAGGLARAQAPASVDAALKEAARRFADPDFLRSALGHPGSGRLARLLESLNVRFKTFEAADDDGAALGFEYDVSKSLLRSSGTTAWSLDFIARGNVAFERVENPDDFLDTSFRMHWFGTHAFGGAAAAPADDAGLRARVAEKIAAATDLETLRADPDVAGLLRADARSGSRSAAVEKMGNALELAAFDPAQFAKVSAKAAHMQTVDEIRNDPEYIELERRFFEGYLHRLPPEIVWDAGLRAALESNQDFSSRQATFGADAGGKLVVWNPKSTAAQANVFDYPAALLRWLLGTTDSFEPSGDAYPTVVVGVDLVDGADDEVRSALTSDDAYVRGRVEAGMRSRIAEVDHEMLFLSVGWRAYQELDAPSAVSDADLDASSHFQAKLDLSHGWSLSYAVGRLPLDTRDDSTFELGFQVRF
jgi:hypothetical protein